MLRINKLWVLIGLILLLFFVISAWSWNIAKDITWWILIMVVDLVAAILSVISIALTLRWANVDDYITEAFMITWIISTFAVAANPFIIAISEQPDLPQKLLPWNVALTIIVGSVLYIAIISLLKLLNRRMY